MLKNCLQSANSKTCDKEYNHDNLIFRQIKVQGKQKGVYTFSPLTIPLHNLVPKTIANDTPEILHSAHSTSPSPSLP